MDEVWKDVVGYEGFYQVSNIGRIKSLERRVPYVTRTGKTAFRTIPEAIRRMGSNGRYKMITVCKDGIETQLYVHRVVASAFLPNPENKEQVNHINGCKEDNSVGNLEWCTASENIQHSVRTGLQPFNPARGGKAGKSRRVLNTETNQVYETIIDAAKNFGVGVGYMRDCLSGIRKNRFPLVKISKS